MSLEKLKHKTVAALSWSFLESSGALAVQFVIGIILARLLLPEHFGLIAMLAFFMALAQSFLHGGFGLALIQKRDATHTDACSIFYFNIAVGFAAAGLLCLVSPWIAAFYDQPLLSPLTRLMSLSIVFSSFGLIHNTVLFRAIDFKTMTKVTLAAALLSGIFGVGLALRGFGVWSLALQQVSNAFFRTVLLWIFNSWRPALVFSLSSLREMFSFGSRLLASGLLTQIFDNIFLLVIGKLFSATDLGFYARGRLFADVPQEVLTNTFGRVTFPIFSKIQDDRARLKRGMTKVLTLLVLINFPLMVGLAVIARPLVLMLLTDKWGHSIPYVQLLCLNGLMYPMHVVNLNILSAMGRSDLFLRLEIIKKILIVVSMILTWRWGISAMLYGVIAVGIVSLWVNGHYTGVFIGYPVRAQLRDVAPFLLSAILMGVVVYAIGLLPFSNRLVMLLLQTSAGASAYAGLCWLLRLPAFMELTQVGFDRLPFVAARFTR